MTRPFLIPVRLGDRDRPEKPPSWLPPPWNGKPPRKPRPGKPS